VYDSTWRVTSVGSAAKAPSGGQRRSFAGVDVFGAIAETSSFAIGEIGDGDGGSTVTRADFRGRGSTDGDDDDDDADDDADDKADCSISRPTAAAETMSTCEAARESRREPEKVLVRTTAKKKKLKM
jgi:hypothetical protein